MKQHLVFIVVSLGLSLFVWRLACQLGEYQRYPEINENRMEVEDLNGVWRMANKDTLPGAVDGNASDWLMLLSDGFMIRSQFPSGHQISLIGEYAVVGEKYRAVCHPEHDSSARKIEWSFSLEGDSLLAEKVCPDSLRYQGDHLPPEIWVRKAYVAR